MAIGKRLTEQAVLVVETIARRRLTDCRHRIKEAGRQAPEATVAKTRVVFFIDQIFKIQPHTFQRIFDIVINTQR